MNFFDKDFPFLQSTSIWTVAFSTMGGIYKANLQPNFFLSVVTLDSTVAVASYAFVSALVGYCTKKVLDSLFKKNNPE